MDLKIGRKRRVDIFFIFTTDKAALSKNKKRKGKKKFVNRH